MKDFLKNFKLPLILGGCAILAVAATLIIVTGGFSGEYGLYITGAYGSVSVTSSDVSEAVVSGDALKEGDVVTVGENSSCTIAYRGKKNSQNNNFTLGSNSQIVISNAFDGKSDGELFLRCGTLIGNFNDDDKSSVNVRTADSMISLKKSVAKISYYTNEFMSYTDVYTIMGQNNIQLYDAAGNPFNDPETQYVSRWGRIISDEGPSFDSLNLEFGLNELTVFDLKQLLTISALIDEGFPYNAEELRAVYEEKGGDEASTPPPQTETEPVVTEPTESVSDPVQSAAPIDTAPPPTETTLPGQTTTRPWSQTAAPTATTTASTTQPPAETTTDEENTDLLQPDDEMTSPDGTGENSGEVHFVTVIINGEETLQEVAHGENAVKPADPVIDGLTFIGWDKSFENITQDTVITAMFKETSGDPNATSHTVTVVINGRSNTIVVEHGQSANLPNTLNVEGYIFKGWDKDFSNITQDITITAILEPQTQAHTVTFIINGQSYPVQVEHGGTAVPPYIPSEDTGFIGWDKTLNNITADTTVTAVFSAKTNYTVTFMIDGHSYAVTVENGATVEPPFQPTTDASGRKFIGWDRGSLSNITSDTIITAIFA